MHKDLKKIATALVRYGFRTERTKSGHLKVFLGSRWITTFSGSPSDTRSWANSLSHIKRQGFTWPPRRPTRTRIT